MSHFPWIYLKHTQEARGPPPTSRESGGSWIGRRKGDLATVLLRSELGQEMMWRRRLRKALSRTPQHGKEGNTCEVLGRAQLGECFFPVRVPGNARFDRAVWEEKKVWLKLTDRNHKSVTHPQPKHNTPQTLQLRLRCAQTRAARFRQKS